MSRSSLIILLIFISANCFSQQNDFRAMVAAGIEKRISPSFAVSLTHESILNQNLSELGLSFMEMGISYRLSSLISFRLGYRYAKRRNLDNFYDDRQVLLADIVLSKGIKNFNLTWRNRLQSQYYPDLFTDNYQQSIIYSRQKISIRYKWNYHIQPFLSFEEYFPVKHPSHNLPDRLITEAGTYYVINDYFRIQTLFSFGHEMNQIDKNTYYSIGLACYYRF